MKLWILTADDRYSPSGYDSPKFSLSRYSGEIEAGDLFYLRTASPEQGLLGWGIVNEVILPPPVKSARPLLPEVVAREVNFFSKVIPLRLFNENELLRSLTAFDPEGRETVFRLAPEEAREINLMISEFGFQPPPLEGAAPHIDIRQQNASQNMAQQSYIPPQQDEAGGLIYPWQGYVTASALNLRKGPGVNFSLIQVLPQNSLVSVIDRQGDWLRLKVGDVEGFAAAQYVTPGVPEEPEDDVDVPQMSLIVDLSRFQRIVDPQILSGRVAGAYIRVSNGTKIDDTYRDNWIAAESAGLLRGAYHFWNPAADPLEQAELFTKAVLELGDGGLPPVVDVEKAENPEGLKVLIDEITARLRRPAIYTAAAQWNGFGGLAWASEYPLWVANYHPNINLQDPEETFRQLSRISPVLPNDWRQKGWTIWQFTDVANGAQYGLSSQRATLSVIQRDPSELVSGDRSVELPVTPPLALIPDRASFSNDVPGRIDSLNFTDYVRGFARLLADVDVKLPIAIGLFGNWGVGKTHFINMLQANIDKLVEGQAADKQNRRFVRRVSQITFNAWNYIDTNLWASLAIHIFDELAREIQPSTEKSYFEVRRELRSSLTSSKFIKNEAVSRRNQAKSERNDQQILLKTYQKSREDQELKLQKSRWKNLLRVNEPLSDRRQEVEKIARQFGLEPVIETYADATRLAEELKGLTGRGDTLLTAFSEQFSTSRGALVTVLGGLAFLALVLIVFGPGVDAVQASVPRLQDIWSESINSVMQIASLAGGLITWAGTKMSRLRTGIEKLEKLQKDLENPPVSVPLSEDEQKIVEAITKLDSEIEAAEQKIAAAEQTIASTQAELQRIDEGGLVYDFLSLRLRDPRYAENLGIISIIRKDLDDLQELLVSWASTEDLTTDLPPVERIILYIDDLDRCPLDKVVDVLQAVHLLLAFKLFVVVVAVDPRWLERSLLKAYVPGDARNGNIEEFNPQNYLEKIFQIPFSIPGMTQEGYQNLVDDLIETRRERDPLAGSVPPTMATPAEVVPDAVDEGTGDAGEESEPSGETIEETDERSESGAEETVDRGSEESIESQAEILPFLEDSEEAFLKLFGDFVETPRLTKRLVNIYQLLRFQIAFKEDRFLRFIDNDRGEYLAAIMLMAMNIGFPKIGGRLLRILHDDRITGTWNEFLNIMHPSNNIEKPPQWFDPTCIYDLDPEEFSEMVSDFTRVKSLAAQLEEPIVLPEDIEVFKTWAVEVSRFSFDWYRG